MMKQLPSLLLMLIVTQTLGLGRSGSVDKSNASTKKLDSLRIEQFATYNALGEISEKAQVVIGLDAVEPKSESTINLDFPGGTVADLLNMFVGAVPEYRWWETNSGAIRVSRDGGHVSLLDVVVRYPGMLKKTRRDIWQDIAQRPEVSTWMELNKCSRGEIRNGKEFRDHNEPISIEARSLTVADLLDEVATKSGTNYWAVLRSPAGTSCSIQIILW